MQISIKDLKNLIHEELETIANIDGVEELVVSPGLKVKHEETGLLFTVKDVNESFVTLLSPKGNVKKLSIESFNKKFIVA